MIVECVTEVCYSAFICVLRSVASQCRILGDLFINNQLANVLLLWPPISGKSCTEKINKRKFKILCDKPL